MVIIHIYLKKIIVLTKILLIQNIESYINIKFKIGMIILAIIAPQFKPLRMEERKNQNLDANLVIIKLFKKS